MLKTTSCTPNLICPNCDNKMDSSSALVEDNIPTEGDVSICIRCAHIAIFDKDLQLKEPTLEEKQELLWEKSILKARIAILATQLK